MSADAAPAAGTSMRSDAGVPSLPEATSPDSHAEALLDIDGATVLRDGRPILDDLHLRVAAGQHTVIVGPNGAGKSTLVKLIARRIYPLAREDGRGRVRVFGRERWNVVELRGLLGIVSPALQREYTTDATLKVFDAVVSAFFSARGLGLELEDRVDATMRERAAEALAEIGASHLATRDMASLSTGEARRVLIARALVHHPRALLLDEPCAGLDLASRRRFLRRLQDLARRGTTLLLVTHHVEEILPEVQQAVVLREGRVFVAGSKRKMLSGANFSAVFGMPIQITEVDGWYHASIGSES